ncbi:MAG: hypothetical protein H7326_01940 [Bdellovibrionaceae bacterium]|nr:hypothetical protein [Pseudobdellovibrionaceae bacterium]
MKTTLVLLILGPLMSFAEGNFDFESLKAPAPLPQTCRQFSDATCFGRTGMCPASGFPEKNGDVSCSCN